MLNTAPIGIGPPLTLFWRVLIVATTLGATWRMSYTRDLGHTTRGEMGRFGATARCARGTVIHRLCSPQRAKCAGARSPTLTSDQLIAGERRGRFRSGSVRFDGHATRAPAICRSPGPLVVHHDDRSRTGLSSTARSRSRRVRRTVLDTAAAITDG
jgi:hypothetical protein